MTGARIARRRAWLASGGVGRSAAATRAPKAPSVGRAADRRRRAAWLSFYPGFGPDPRQLYYTRRARSPAFSRSLCTRRIRWSPGIATRQFLEQQTTCTPAP